MRPNASLSEGSAHAPPAQAGGRALSLAAKTAVALCLSAAAGCASTPVAALPVGDRAVETRLAENRAPVEAVLAKIADNGASSAAKTELERLIRSVVGPAAPRVAQRLARQSLRFVIVPNGSEFTEVEPFQVYAGQPLPDGADWQRLGGAFHRLLGGSPVIGLRESELDAGLFHGRRFPDGQAFLHELGHALYALALDARERSVVLAAYRHFLDANRLFKDSYAKKNAHEFFAQGVAMYFDAISPHPFKDGSEYLRDEDPGLFALLEGLFGPTRR